MVRARGEQRALQAADLHHDAGRDVEVDVLEIDRDGERAGAPVCRPGQR